MSLRTTHRSALQDSEFDVLIIGAGINGAAAACALAHRGLRTALVDTRDFAGYTSQSSSNLIWGGIKYLESFEFALVRRLCRNRNRLMRAYPTMIRETRFLATVSHGVPRSRLIVWLGAWFYWLLGNGMTRIPRLYSAAVLKRTEPILDTASSQGGVEYSDALLVDGDARFVFSLIRRAVDAGCTAVNYLALTGVRRTSGYWQVDLRDSVDGERISSRARVIVNAAGPFADSVANLAGVVTDSRHVLSKGVHLVTQRLVDTARVLAFFADDGRPFFVIPLGHCSSIGTTDTPVAAPTGTVAKEDRDFILDNINARLDLRRPLSRDEVISERCGVRPLAVGTVQPPDGDFLSLSRKHVIDTDVENAFVSIFGGKLTDCLEVGAQVRDTVLALGLADPANPRCWYGEESSRNREEFFARAQLFMAAHPAFDKAWCERLWRAYGARAVALVKKLANEPGAAEVILDQGAITRAELELLRDTEFVVTLEDFLRRRTLLAQTFTDRDLGGGAMMRACRTLFGNDALVRYREYFATAPLEEADMAGTIATPKLARLPIVGIDDLFPVHRIYCVGRNYAAHAVEMGHDPDREAPFFFQKNPDNLVPGDGEFPYPDRSTDVQHEVELVVALQHGGNNIAVGQALACVFGYAVGLDMTRRDLQAEMKRQGRPWEIGKAFEHSAPCSAIAPASSIGHPQQGPITLEKNGELCQAGDLAQMIWKVPEIISELSNYFCLQAGDLIFTGTPAGVGPVSRGDTLTAAVAGVAALSVTVT